MKLTGIKTSNSGAVEQLEAVTENTVLFAVGDVVKREYEGQDPYYQLRVTLADQKKNRFPIKYNKDTEDELVALKASFQAILDEAEAGTCPPVADGIEVVGRVTPFSFDGGDAMVSVSWFKDVPVKASENVNVSADQLGW